MFFLLEDTSISGLVQSSLDISTHQEKLEPNDTYSTYNPTFNTSSVTKDSDLSSQNSILAQIKKSSFSGRKPENSLAATYSSNPVEPTPAELERTGSSIKSLLK